MAPLNMLRLTILIAVLSFAAIAQADYVGPFTETWSDDGDLKGWSGDVSHDTNYHRLALNGAPSDTPALRGTIISIWATSDSWYTPGTLVAETTPFLGDLSGANGIAFDFGLNIEEGTDLGKMEVFMYGRDDITSATSVWRYDLSTPELGKNFYEVAFDSPDWVNVSNATTWAGAISDVDAWGIFWSRTGEPTDTVTGYLDNFDIYDDAGPAVPEPATMTLVMLGLGSLGYLRRRKASTK